MQRLEVRQMERKARRLENRRGIDGLQQDQAQQQEAERQLHLSSRIAIRLAAGTTLVTGTTGVLEQPTFLREVARVSV